MGEDSFKNYCVKIFQILKFGNTFEKHLDNEFYDLFFLFTVEMTFG